MDTLPSERVDNHHFSLSKLIIVFGWYAHDLPKLENANFSKKNVIESFQVFTPQVLTYIFLTETENGFINLSDTLNISNLEFITHLQSSLQHVVNVQDQLLPIPILDNVLELIATLPSPYFYYSLRFLLSNRPQVVFQLADYKPNVSFVKQYESFIYRVQYLYKTALITQIYSKSIVNEIRKIMQNQYITEV